MTDLNEYVTIKDLVKMKGCSRQNVQQAIRRKGIPVVRVGNVLLVLKKDAYRVFERKRAQRPDPEPDIQSEQGSSQ